MGSFRIKIVGFVAPGGPSEGLALGIFAGPGDGRSGGAAGRPNDASEAVVIIGI